MGLLDGKVGIVTGAGSGIGRATARRVAHEGGAVVVADINAGSAAETVREIEAEGGRAVAQWVDVAEEPAVEAMVRAAIDAFGRLDYLHNNAANVTVVPQDLDVVGMDVDVWDATMAVNVRGPMLGCKHAIPHMIRQGGGSIVNTSSAAGQFGDLSRVAYGVSKAGVNSLTRYVATLYGKQGIRCNAVVPGVIATPALVANVDPVELAKYEANMCTPYLGRPEDIAAAVVFLFGDEARYITGHLLNADGGMTIHNPIFAQMLQA